MSKVNKTYSKFRKELEKDSDFAKVYYTDNEEIDEQPKNQWKSLEMKIDEKNNCICQLCEQDKNKKGQEGGQDLNEVGQEVIPPVESSVTPTEKQRIKTVNQKVNFAGQKVKAVNQKINHVIQKIKTVNQKVNPEGQKVNNAGQKVKTVNQKINSTGQNEKALNPKINNAVQKIKAVNPKINPSGPKVKAVNQKVNNVSQKINPGGQKVNVVHQKVIPESQTVNLEREEVNPVIQVVNPPIKSSVKIINQKVNPEGQEVNLVKSGGSEKAKSKPANVNSAAQINLEKAPKILRMGRRVKTTDPNSKPVFFIARRHRLSPYSYWGDFVGQQINIPSQPVNPLIDSNNRSEVSSVDPVDRFLENVNESLDFTGSSMDNLNHGVNSMDLYWETSIHPMGNPMGHSIQVRELANEELASQRLEEIQNVGEYLGESLDQCGRSSVICRVDQALDSNSSEDLLSNFVDSFCKSLGHPVDSLDIIPDHSYCKKFEEPLGPTSGQIVQPVNPLGLFFGQPLTSIGVPDQSKTAIVDSNNSVGHFSNKSCALGNPDEDETQNILNQTAVNLDQSTSQVTVDTPEIKVINFRGRMTKMLQCYFCNKKMLPSHRLHLEAHMQTHTFETPFKCHFCSKLFKSATILGKHEIFAHGYRRTPYSCPKCYKLFPFEYILKLHLKFVHSTKKFVKKSNNFQLITID